MKDEDKTKEQLLAEVADLRRKIVELEMAIEDRDRIVGERTAELTATNRRLVEITAERRQAEDACRESSENLKLFAYSVVHDLKSPSVGVHGLTKLLCRHYEGLLDEKGRTYCRQILKASAHIAELVEQINSFIIAKEAPLNIEKVRVKDVLRAISDEFSVQMSRRRIKWVAPEGEIELRVDRSSLLRVFRNLVENALKYGGDCLSEIRVGYLESDTVHIFTVADDGPGMREEDSERIFSLFNRNATAPSVAGAGLGLAIVKEIAERHRGRAWVEAGTDRGTTFHVAIAKDI